MVSKEPSQRPSLAGIRKALKNKFAAVDLQLKKRRKKKKTASEPSKGSSEKLKKTRQPTVKI